jgi:hypothetical protein
MQCSNSAARKAARMGSISPRSNLLSKQRARDGGGDKTARRPNQPINAAMKMKAASLSGGREQPD